MILVQNNSILNSLITIMDEVKTNPNLSLIGIDKGAFHFLLDKCVHMITAQQIGSPYQGGTIYNQAFMLIEALHNTEKEIKRNPSILMEEKAQKQTLLKDIFQSFGLLIQWDYRLQRTIDDRRTIARDAFKILQDTSITIPILLPTGCIGHSVLLSIQRNKNGTIRLTLYNTGPGLDAHSRWDEDSRHFQTYLCFDDIPLQGVEEDALEKLLSAKSEK